MALKDKKTDYERLVPFLDWAYLEKQHECGGNKAFKKAWAKLFKTLLEENGWTVEDFNTEIDRRRIEKWAAAGGIK